MNGQLRDLDIALGLLMFPAAWILWHRAEPVLCRFFERVKRDDR